MVLSLSRPLRRLAVLRLPQADRLRFPVAVAGFCVAYFLAAKLGIATSLPPQGIVTIWPPNAIVLFALLLVHRDKWWVFLAATVATEIFADVPAYPLWAAAGYGLVNFFEAALAALLLQTVRKRALPLVGVRDFTLFVALGPVLASGTAALFGAAIYKLGAPELDYLHYWRVFWFGDATGLLVVGTALLAWQRPQIWPHPSRLLSLLEAGALTLGLVAAASFALLTEPSTPLVYLIFPFLLWAAIRFGVRGACCAILATVTIAIGSAINGVGPFSHFPTIDNVMALQGLVAVVTLSTFMVAFSVEESVRWSKQLAASNRELDKVNRELDQIVSARTKKLKSAVSRNEMLLKEVHHRVKNNLQLVSSLLGFHGRSTSDPEWRGKLAGMQGQIDAMAAAYDVIHQMDSVETVDFGRVVRQLCRSLADTHGELVTISATTTGKAMVPSDTAIALALALNELITNSVKHAAGSSGIAVSCRSDGKTMLATVSDDGPGFPPGFALEQAESFGVRMVRSVVADAKGQLRVLQSDRGATVEIAVPLAPAEARRGGAASA